MASRLLEIQTRIYNLLANWLPEGSNSGAEPSAPAQTILENQNRMYDLLAARFAQMPDEIVDAVLQYLEDHPEALNQAAVEAILDGRLDDIEEGLGGLKSAVNTLEEDAFKISAGSAVTEDSSADGERWNYVNGDYIKGTTGTAQYWNNKKYTVQENTYYIVTGCYMTTAPMVIFVDANNNFIGNSGLITISGNYVRDTITIKTPIGTASIIVQNFGESDVYPNVKNGVVTSTFDDIKRAIEDLEAGSLSALGATAGQVPTADGEGSWKWTTPSGGGGAVQDVQVNGVSVLQDGVANVPIASTTLGVVKKRNQDVDGIYIDSSGYIAVYPGTPANIKAGTAENRPVGIKNQHYSVFYGLAKAAGSDEKDSTLPVGQYTEAAKSAIQTMLGISGIIAPVEDATASKPYAIGDPFLHGGALYKASAAIAAGDAIVPETNCTQTTIIEMLKGA